MLRRIPAPIPSQLAKENRRFVYGALRKGARDKDFELAIQWLKDCGLIQQVIRLSKPALPLPAYADEGFKMFLSDVGLLGAMSGLDVTTLLHIPKMKTGVEKSRNRCILQAMSQILQLNLIYCKDTVMKKFLLMIAFLPFLLSGANIFLAGDSTMCIYKETSAPQQGWGMALQPLCKDGVKVFNYAQGGRSSMSFITEKRWERIRREAKKGDFVIIQFGHNDAHRGEKNLYRSTDPQTTFKLYLRLYVAEARARGMIPILCTQTALCIFKDGKTVNKRNTYINACREIAAETKCALIDLNAYAIEKMTAMGKKEASKFHMIFAPGENPKFPKGRNDVCHLTGVGAKFYAEALVELAKKQKLPIAELFK